MCTLQAAPRVRARRVRAAEVLPSHNGTYRLKRDLPDGARRTVDGAYLHAWRQVAGEWQIEAVVAHPARDA